MAGNLADIITCAKFQGENFRAYDFTGGRISHFRIDFRMGLTTVQRDCAACDNVFAVDNTDTIVVSAVNVIHELSVRDSSWESMGSSWESMGGVTSLGDELYILRRYAHKDSDDYVIDVYSKTDFAFLRGFSVPRRSYGIRDITSCTRLDCLLIADSDGKCLHKVFKDGRNSPEIWPLSEKPYMLSAGRGWDVSVLVSCRREGTLSNTIGIIMELNIVGECVRRIVLQPLMTAFWHAVELSSDEFVIAYRSCWCARGDIIAIVDNGDKVKQSYGNWWIPPSETALLRGASHMAVDSDGFIFVSDDENSRLVLLNPSLKLVRYIATKKYPRWLHFDQNSRRLFVGHNSNTVSVLQL